MSEIIRPSESALRRYFRTRSRLLLFALLVWSVAVEFGPLHWIADLGSHFRFFYAIASLVLGGLLFSFRHRRLALLAAVLCGWHTLRPPGLVEYAFTGKPQAAAQGTRTHSLISFNLLYRNTRFDEIRAALEAEDPDLLLLLEASPAAAAALKPFATRYPHQLQKLHDHPFGIWFLSKWPLRDARIITPARDEDETVVADIELSAQRLRFVGAHPIPPMGRASWSTQARQMQAYSAMLAEAPTAPRMLAGDLNATPFSSHFQKLLRDASLRDAALGCGFRPTWSPFWPLPGIAIDHVLVSDAVRIHQHQIGPELGSDHRWVKVVFSLSP